MAIGHRRVSIQAEPQRVHVGRGPVVTNKILLLSNLVEPAIEVMRWKPFSICAWSYQ